MLILQSISNTFHISTHMTTHQKFPNANTYTPRIFLSCFPACFTFSSSNSFHAILNFDNSFISKQNQNNSCQSKIFGVQCSHSFYSHIIFAKLMHSVFMRKISTRAVPFVFLCIPIHSITTFEHISMIFFYHSHIPSCVIRYHFISLPLLTRYPVHWATKVIVLSATKENISHSKQIPNHPNSINLFRAYVLSIQLSICSFTTKFQLPFTH